MIYESEEAFRLLSPLAQKKERDYYKRRRRQRLGNVSTTDTVCSAETGRHVVRGLLVDLHLHLWHLADLQ